MIPMTAADIVDRYAILTVKWSKINEPKALAEISKQRRQFREACIKLAERHKEITALRVKLFDLNAHLWELEARMSRLLAEETEDAENIAHIARQIRRYNFHRVAVKNEINELCGEFTDHRQDYAEGQPLRTGELPQSAT